MVSIVTSGISGSIRRPSKTQGDAEGLALESSLTGKKPARLATENAWGVFN